MIQQLQDETQIKEDLFLQVLCGLLKSKLIVCPEINEEELEEDLKESDIKMTYSIRIANDFKRCDRCTCCSSSSCWLGLFSVRRSKSI